LKNFRDFLEQRETELLDRLAERKRQTIPFEAELHEIRRAKTALAADAQVPGNELRRYLEVRERELRETINEITGDLDGVHGELAEIDKVKAAIGLAPSTVLSAASRAGEKPAKWERVAQAAGIPYQSLTIKQLILKALNDHFPTGATVSQLVEFFREQWGRDIEKQSLSPQLTRLFTAGLIGQFEEGREWFHIYQGDKGGRHAYRNRTTGDINWKFPSQAAQDDIPAKLPVSSHPDLD